MMGNSKILFKALLCGKIKLNLNLIANMESWSDVKPEEVVNKNLGRYVLPMLSKVGAPELNFWLQAVVSGTNFCWNVCLRSWKLAKIGKKLVLKKQDFFKKYNWSWKSGSSVLKSGLKKGVLRVAHPCTTFQCESPPPGCQAAIIYKPEWQVTITFYDASLLHLQEKRGEQLEYSYIDTTRVLLKYRLPLNEVVVDFFDLLKSVTSGYARWVSAKQK